MGWLGIEDRGTGGSVGSRLGGISSGQLPLGSPNRLGGISPMKKRATTAMSATTHSKLRSGGRRTSLLVFAIASCLVGRDVRLLELAFGSLSEVNGDTGFELRGGLGCHVGRDGRAILHAV